MPKTTTVEMDDRGAVHIPASVRRKLKARRFKLFLENGRIPMEPVRAPSLREANTGVS